MFVITGFISAQINVGNFIGTYKGKLVQWFSGNLNTFSNHTVTLTPLSQNPYFEGNDQAILWQTPFVLNNDSTFCDTSGGNCICRYGYFYKFDSIYVYACALSGQWSKYYGKKINAVGVNEYEKNNEITIFPNPSSSKITIDLSNILFLDEKSNISLKNALGQIILITSFNSKQTEIDVSKLIEGIYFIELNTVNGVFNKKVVISK